jgi:hypothetical protein
MKPSRILLVTTMATGALYVVSFVALHRGHPGVETSGRELVAWFSENGAQVQAWFWAGLAFHPQDLDPGTARVLLDITQFWGPVVNSSMVAMAAPVAALGLGADPVVPRWLAWLSAVFGIEQAIETITVFGRSGFIAPGGTMNVYLGGFLGFLFVVGLLVWAMPRLDRAAAST